MLHQPERSRANRVNYGGPGEESYHHTTKNEGPEVAGE